MSEESVEIVRSMYERMTQTGDPQEALSYFDPAIEFEISWQGGRDSPDFRVLHGIDEVREATAELLGAFEDARYEVHELVDAGDDVVAILEFVARPKDSSAEISTGRFGYVFTLRSGKVVRVQDFPEPAEALRAAGLSEQSRPEEQPD
jgi:ketosteroid isomerase-like protein